MAAEVCELTKCQTSCLRTCVVSLTSHNIFMVWARYLFYRGELQVQRVKGLARGQLPRWGLSPHWSHSRLSTPHSQSHDQRAWLDVLSLLSQ